MNSIFETNILNFFILIVLICQLDHGLNQDQEATKQCLCSVEKNGEYCGTELNEKNQENSCPTKLFVCGDTNRNKQAIMLMDCQPGQECDQKSFFSNACLKNYKCECPKGLERGQTYCGDMLVGEDCMKNITYSCPYLSMIFNPSPVDACLYGCQNGTCLPSPSSS